MIVVRITYTILYITHLHNPCVRICKLREELHTKKNNTNSCEQFIRAVLMAIIKVDSLWETKFLRVLLILSTVISLYGYHIWWYCLYDVCVICFIFVIFIFLLSFNCIGMFALLLSNQSVSLKYNFSFIFFILFVLAFE